MTEPTSRDGIPLEAGTNEVEFLLFFLGKQPYGMNVSKVCHISIFDREAVRLLPHQRPEVVGIIDFRGKTVSVIDLGIHLGLTHAVPLSEEALARRLLIVAEFNQRTTAYIVDAVDRIQRCSWEKFESITDSTCDATAVIGTVRVPNEGLVVILDLETIMSTIDPTMAIDYYEKSILPATVARDTIRIVYCEDSTVIQKMLLKTLEGAGFRNFKTFFTGAEGLEYFKKTSSDQVDVILSDIEMPSMDGLTLCRELRELQGYKKTPFIFFSSMINEAMRRKCDGVGGDAAFSKPEIHHIVHAIEDLVSKAAAARKS
jgi:two-component system chemotaxis response regulator CheV